MRWQQGNLGMITCSRTEICWSHYLLSFLSQYHTHEELSVDEAMIPFKGRLSIKQYMKDKPTKWGIKVFVLADSKTSYTVRLQVYTEEKFKFGGC